MTDAEGPHILEPVQAGDGEADGKPWGHRLFLFLRAMAAISPLMWIVGFAALLAAAILFPNPIIFIIVLFAGLESWRRFKDRKSPEHREYHDVSAGTRIAVAAVYLGLALLLVVGMHYTHFHRTLN